MADAIGSLVEKLVATYENAMGAIKDVENKAVEDLEAVRRELDSYTLERGVWEPHFNQ